MLIERGTEAQKQRYLPRILCGRRHLVPGLLRAGRGLRSRRPATRAEDRGDHFVVNGQKVWTSGAQFADWIYLLVRTDPAAPKHRGISYLLVDMKTPGITVRPLVLHERAQHFNEVFFVDVAVPKANLSARRNEGWKLAMTTLMYERKAGGGRGHDGADRAARRARAPGEDRRRGRVGHPLVRQRLAQLAIDATAFKYTRYRNLTRQLRGEPPGPEGSILKLFGSELGVRIADFAGELLGPRVLLNQRERGRARRAALVQPRGQLAAVHHRGRHQRDPAQHHRRARARLAEGLTETATEGALT